MGMDVKRIHYTLSPQVNIFLRNSSSLSETDKDESIDDNSLKDEISNNVSVSTPNIGRYKVKLPRIKEIEEMETASYSDDQLSETIGSDLINNENSSNEKFHEGGENGKSDSIISKGQNDESINLDQVKKSN